MIVKGRARSGPAQLAAYLLRQDGKERPTLIQLFDGGNDLHKAFLQWDAIGEMTNGVNTLYHAQIAPEARYEMTPEQWKRAAEILATELGMGDHPRAIVVHDGGDKPHAHVVFQRTNADTLTLWDDGNNYLKHERASLRMEQEFAQEHVPGKHAKRDRQKQPEFPRAKSDQNEQQQAARTELTPEERKEQVTALRAAADSAQAFKSALEDAGYILAKGDKRGLVIVDRDGEVYSLSRHITDLSSKEYKSFMAPLDPKALPSVSDAKQLVEEAKARQAERPATGTPAEKPAGVKEPEQQGIEASKFFKVDAPKDAPKPVEQTPIPAPKDAQLEALEKAINDRYQQEQQKFRELHAHQLRQAEYDLDLVKKQKLADFDAILTEQKKALKERHAEHRTGLAGFLDAVKLRLNPTLAAEQAAERRKETQQLARRHAKERADYVKLMEQSKQLEVENLKERQSLQLRDLATKTEADRERYIREYKDAQRIADEVKLRQEERDKQRRDGPEPPGPRVR